METLNMTRIFYDADTDELDVVFNYPEPQPAYSHLVKDDFYLRLKPTTHEVVGAMVCNASYYFAAIADALATQTFDAPPVRHYLQQQMSDLLASLQPA